MLSTDELLKPRIKMIAPIPKVFSCGIEVGQIWTAEDGFFNLTGAHRIGLVEIKKYPHLFKELSWFEERSNTDMPKYVKFSEPPYKGYHKTINHFVNKYCYEAENGAWYPYEYLQPITEKEYLEYQSLNQIN